MVVVLLALRADDMKGAVVCGAACFFLSRGSCGQMLLFSSDLFFFFFCRSSSAFDEKACKGVFSAGVYSGCTRVCIYSGSYIPGYLPEYVPGYG